jgi:hypothetical protein
MAQRGHRQFEADLTPIPVNEFWGIVYTKENVSIKEIVAIPVDISSAPCYSYWPIQHATTGNI